MAVTVTYPKRKHIIFFSGGACSYMTAKRVIAQYGVDNVELMFSDTSYEDESLYKFVEDSAKVLGAKLTILKDGRNVWDMAEQDNFVYNSMIANCTKELKIATARRYIKENYLPSEVVLYMGIDWTEPQRYGAPLANWAPYILKFPMGEAPYLNKDDMLVEIAKDGLEVPRLYEMGFAHNNCGGFCFKAGIGHFIHLFKKMPERFLKNAERERERERAIRALI